MLRRAFLLIGFPIMLAHAVVSCVAAKPATYGGALATCDLQAATWEEYTPCCVVVAQRFNRDPSFCFRATDAGSQDGGSK